MGHRGRWEVGQSSSSGIEDPSEATADDPPGAAFQHQVAVFSSGGNEATSSRYRVAGELSRSTMSGARRR